MFRQTFWQIVFLETSSDFHNFWTSKKIFHNSEKKTFGSVVTTAFCVPRWIFFNFWKREMKENLFFFENFASLWFSDFERKRSLVLLQAWLRQACQKFVVHVQMKIFTNKFFGTLIIFSSFLEIQQNFFRILTRNFRQGGHNCILHVHRNLFRKVIFLSNSLNFFSWFSESELNISGLSEKIVCYRCQNCILRC